MDQLRERLEQAGYNQDVSVGAALADNAALSETRYTSPRWDRSWRDNRPLDSIHIAEKDGATVAHLERFNPEHHLLLHLLIDVPIWRWKNQIQPLLNRLPL